MSSIEAAGLLYSLLYVAVVVSLACVVVVVGSVCVAISASKNKTNKKPCNLGYINNYSFPAEIEQKLLIQYPQLTAGQVERVMQGLRSYFYICCKYGGQTAMPSRVVDTAWHEFLLFSKDYFEFSEKAFGSYFHHIPASRMTSPLDAQKSLMKAWRNSCYEESIADRYPNRLPLLFALDAELAIEGGCVYSIEAGIYPQTHFGVPPEWLLEEINESLPLEPNELRKDSVKWKAETKRLAAKTKLYLLNDGYCKWHGPDKLRPLFDSVLARKSLTVAVFGDKTQAMERYSRYVLNPWPDQCDCIFGNTV